MWVSASEIELRSGRVKLRRSHIFDKNARPRIEELAREYAGRPSIPVLQSRPLTTTLQEAKEEAWKFYRDWRGIGSFSPRYGYVGVTLRAWRHLTKASSPADMIIHRLSLLPCAKELIELSSKGALVRVTSPDGPRTELQSVRGVVRPKFRAAIVVEVVLEVRFPCERYRATKLYSVYERGKLWDV
jgi:hypothetical protein